MAIKLLVNVILALTQ